MKKTFYFTMSLGIVSILLAALSKELHWHGKKEFLICGITSVALLLR